MNQKILVVDDERPIAEIIKYNLQKEGFEVQTVYDGEDAIKMVHKMKPDLVVLDVMLPRKGGFEILKEIRMEYVMPVIMLTAKEEESDKISGLELGADDYITKPFSTKEVVARVKANLRRVKLSKVEEEMKSKIVTAGNLTIDLNTYEVSKNNEIIDLTNREFDLLKYLFQNADRVFNREHLLKEVWGYEFGDLRTVDVTVRRLREKIETEEDKYIITKRGTGYYFKSK
ncbi:two-component system response regulator VicR [Sedimentibacter acidaminivorans]|uniref:Two-component system response regulator VicR n=1 Tax=Sedimentibacter acidaminivorans TaxID=913099 RepID=A0ABS4GH73_9FIRM|nr:response regulator [Sedimentibacter acidaminivorans]MBP1927051.1 two-component system response regulator VicR [Sedimentibacter acidaminivorans]